jgi:4-hydroxybutyrate dehydrogenase
VPEQVMPAMAEAATRDHCNPTNPRKASKEDYLAMLRAVMG